MASIYDSKSYLSNTTFNKFYLDVAKLPSMENVTGDLVTIPQECEYRIDLFSYKMYRSSRLWWIIALANSDIISDPIWDFKAGLTILVPRDSVMIEQLSMV